MSRRLLVIDSGIGGLSVAREIRRQDRTAEIVYLADDAAFPYGAWDGEALIAHVVELADKAAAATSPDVVVIACNTASTLVLPGVRARLAVPVVGTVPAIKTGAEQTRTGLFSVLATPGTIERDYTHELIKAHAPKCHVRLVGAHQLAGYAEALMAGEAVPQNRVRDEIAPAFVDQGDRRSDVVVLGCTHFVFLQQLLEAAAPWPVSWIDSAPAIARRAMKFLSAVPQGRAEEGV
ncbi:MAG: glutamate racemase [Alphaproteobacteria bacterium]